MFRENSEAIEQCADNVGFRLLGIHCSNDRVVRFDVEVNYMERSQQSFMCLGFRYRGNPIVRSEQMHF
jgi:hypothetical protein